LVRVEVLPTYLNWHSPTLLSPTPTICKLAQYQWTKTQWHHDITVLPPPAPPPVLLPCRFSTPTSQSTLFLPSDYSGMILCFLGRHAPTPPIIRRCFLANTDNPVPSPALAFPQIIQGLSFLTGRGLLYYVLKTEKRTHLKEWIELDCLLSSPLCWKVVENKRIHPRSVIHSQPVAIYCLYYHIQYSLVNFLDFKRHVTISNCRSCEGRRFPLSSLK